MKFRYTIGAISNFLAQKWRQGDGWTGRRIYRKRPGGLLRCPVGKDVEEAFIKAIYKLGRHIIDSMTLP